MFLNPIPVNDKTHTHRGIKFVKLNNLHIIDSASDCLISRTVSDDEDADV